MVGRGTSQHTSTSDNGSSNSLEHRLVREALASSTRASYRRSFRALRKYLALCCPGTKALPLSCKHLAGFITHLCSSRYAHSTIVCTVSAISYGHQTVGLPDPTKQCYIKKLLRGVHTQSASLDSRRPIDIAMLPHLVHATKAVIADPYERRPIDIAMLHHLVQATKAVIADPYERRPIDIAMLPHLVHATKAVIADPYERRPIDIAMLHHLIHATKAVIADPYERRYVAAMFLLAFHGFQRIGEITIRAGVSPHHIIQYSDVDIAPDQHDTRVSLLRLTIRHFKHHTSGRPVVLEFKFRSISCPVKHMRRYMRSRGSIHGQLFVFPDQSPLSRSYFSAQLSRWLIQSGHNPVLYKCHSFRIGATSTAASHGYTDIPIQQMGRCKSNAFRRYIRIPMLTC